MFVRGILYSMRRLAHWLRARRRNDALCVYCGFRGRAATNARAKHIFHCPDCGGDWYSRPPRSYREMEALDLPDVAGVAITSAEPAARAPLIGGLLEMLRIR